MSVNVATAMTASEVEGRAAREVRTRARAGAPARRRRGPGTAAVRHRVARGATMAARAAGHRDGTIMGPHRGRRTGRPGPARHRRHSPRTPWPAPCHSAASASSNSSGKPAPATRCRPGHPACPLHRRASSSNKRRQPARTARNPRTSDRSPSRHRCRTPTNTAAPSPTDFDMPRLKHGFECSNTTWCQLERYGFWATWDLCGSGRGTARRFAG